MEKVLLITGASSAVGMALLGEDLTAFSRLYCHYNTYTPALEACFSRHPADVTPLQADFSKPEGVASVCKRLEELPPVTHFVHLPAKPPVAVRFSKTTTAQFAEQLQIGFFSAQVLLGQLLPVMQKQNFGRVALLLSAYAQGRAPKYMAPYVSAKYALLGLMKSLSSEYAGKNITVNGVSPGMMETKFLEDTPYLAVEQQRAQHPKGRLTPVEEVSRALLYLLSDQTEYLTGQQLVLDGGAG